MAASGDVLVDNTDIGCSDHFLVWMALGRLTNRSKEKCVIKWFANEEGYQEALKAEIHSFSECIKYMMQKDMKGHELLSVGFE